MEKKNFSKKSVTKKSSNKPSDENKKRYSKSKFRKEVKEEQTTKDLYNKKKPMVVKKREYKVEEKYQFAGSVEKTYFALTTQHSMKKRGYDSIVKGQCVKVEEFKDNLLARITTTDGRVGVISKYNVKLMSFSA